MLMCPDCDREFERGEWQDCGDGFFSCPDCGGVFSLQDLGAMAHETVLIEFDPNDLI